MMDTWLSEWLRWSLGLTVCVVLASGAEFCLRASGDRRFSLDVAVTTVVGALEVRGDAPASSCRRRLQSTCDERSVGGWGRLKDRDSRDGLMECTCWEEESVS